MRILVVSQYYYPEPFRIHEICEELVLRGHNVTVLTGNPNYPDGEIYAGYDNKDSEEIINGVRVIRCVLHPRHRGIVNLFFNYLSFLISAMRRVRKLKNEFDVVYAYQLSPITSCQPAVYFAKKFKLPLLMYCLDVWPESIVGQVSEKKLIFKVVSNISARIYNACDRILVTSPSFINYLERTCNVDHCRLRYVPQHADDVLPMIKNIEHSGLNFVFMGNVGLSQNLECFVKACALIENRSGFKLHIVGSGACLDEIKKLAKDLKVEDCIIFHGRKPKSEMPKYYGIADVCLVSLRDEGAVSLTIPGKVQEYMSAGKPILAPIPGDTEFVIKDARCGRALKNDDIDGIATTIKEWVGNPSVLQEMGQHSRRYYEEYFTREKHVDVLEQELETLIENNRKSCLNRSK